MDENARSCDLLIHGGTVIDPANHIFKICDVAVTGSTITAVGENLELVAHKTIDAHGLFVTPGLIDMHCHCYPFFPLFHDSLPNIHPDAHMPHNGVTTAVDAGTCGIGDFSAFRRDLIDHAQVRVLAFLNIADGGMVRMDTEQEPSHFDPAGVAHLAKEHADVVVGIKTAHYWVGKPFDAAHPAWASIDATLHAAELSGLPCMIDFQPTLPERSYQAMLQRLRPGDIHTHMYAQQFPVLNDAGQVSDFLWEARERGVRFDLGHGAGSFLFRNAIPAFEQGFYPDTLSTDLYLDNVAGPVVGLLHILSKYLSMGMPLDQVIARATIAPAQILQHPELGTLSPGAAADIALLQKIDSPIHFADSSGARMAGNVRLTCMGTMRAGKMLYNPYALGFSS